MLAFRVLALARLASALLTSLCSVLFEQTQCQSQNTDLLIRSKVMGVPRSKFHNSDSNSQHCTDNINLLSGLYSGSNKIH